MCRLPTKGVAVALGVPGFVRIGAAIAGCALVAACTPEPTPPTTPTPQPTATVSATPSATPTETEIERQQRSDWEAAESAYREAVAESDRLAQLGGVSKPTARLQSVATAKYLDAQLDSLRFLKARKWRLKGSISVLGVRPVGGWTAERLELLACEDNSTWRMVDTDGADVTPSNVSDYVQTLSVVKVGNRWKVSSLNTKEIPAVTAEDCGS
jgi:hypothetical protein